MIYLHSLSRLSLRTFRQVNKWTATGTSVTPQVRSLRKGNNDHVAIAVDMDTSSTSRIEDEDDDKGNLHFLALGLAVSAFQF